MSLGVSAPVVWNPQQAPHVVAFGATGSGKTYFTKLLLGKIALHEPTAQLRVCDFKGDDDFSFLNGCERFHRFMGCGAGLDEFYKQFSARQSGEDKSRHMLVLFFDEWASYCNNLDKKAVEEEKRKLATLLMLGRSFRVHVIVSQQRADAAYFNAARDNFNLVIGLGNLSEESKNMLFHEFKEQMKPDRKQGTGYMLTNGADFKAVCVPTVSDVKKLHQTILQGVKR